MQKAHYGAIKEAFSTMNFCLISVWDDEEKWSFMHILSPIRAEFIACSVNLFLYKELNQFFWWPL